MYYTSLLLAVAGSVIYHLSMKQTPQNLNPFFTLAISYGAALLLCLIGLALEPAGSTRLTDLNWSVGGLALGIVGIETGFLLAYRAGWNLGYASLGSNALATMVLLPLGYWLFREHLSMARLSGAALTLGGLWLMMKA